MACPGHALHTWQDSLVKLVEAHKAVTGLVAIGEAGVIGCSEELHSIIAQ